MNLRVDTYIPGNTPVHAMDARCKITLLFVYSIGIFWVETWPGIAAYALIACLVCALGRLPWGRVCKLLVPVFVLAAFSVVFNIIPFTVEGLLRGLFFGCRMILLVLASFTVCLTTTSSALIAAFRSIISPLHAFKVPVDDIATTLALSVRFIPVMVEEFGFVYAAQASRAASFSTGSLVARAKAYAGLFVPLFAGLFRHADALATSMDARCYGASRATTLPNTVRIAPSVCVLIVGLAALVLLAVFL